MQFKTHNPINRQVVEQNTVDYYRKAVGTRPDVRVVQIGDDKFIVKDFKGSDLLFRLIVGPILIRREYGALKKLTGLKGIPQNVFRIDRYSFAMEQVEGVSLDKGGLTLDNQFYCAVQNIVHDAHLRGVAHCDLRSPGNVIRASDGNPYVVDWAACVFRGRGFNPFISYVFRLFVIADNNAVLRVKRRLSPNLLSDQEIEELGKPLPYEKTATKFGEGVRNLTRKLLTKRSS